MSKTNIIRPQEGFQEKFVRTNVDFCIGGGTLGSGKACKSDSYVVTPFGYRQVKDLKVGDILSNPDTGGQERIIQVHPYGEFNFYRVSFCDGTFVDCSEGHLWKIRVAGKKTKRYDIYGNRDDWRIMETKSMYDFLENKKQGKYPNWSLSIPLTQPVSFAVPVTPTTPRPIKPYVLGALLGDGCIGKSIQKYVELSTPDEHIVNRFIEYGYDMSHFSNKGGCNSYRIFNKELIEGLKVLKLKDHTAIDKFIPRTYKYASVQERKELMQGLIDTDGYVDKQGHTYYTTISKQLAEDVAFVVRSLGGISSISTKQAGYTDNEGTYHKCNLAYNIRITTPFNEELVSLPKKKERLNGVGYKNGKKFYLEKSIVSVEPIGKFRSHCITVDNPSGLYIVDDFTVTHNSFGAVLSVAEPSLDKNFRGLFLRNNLDDTKASGGLLDTFEEAYGKGVRVIRSENPRIDFPSGARIDVTHVADQSRSKILQRFKGRQYDFIYFDELTGFTWECFSAIYTRNRGTAKWTGKVRATTNPDRNSWIRKFIDWYIGVDGFIRPDRDGVVRYFYMAGESVNDVVWGDTKEEVYNQCRIDIDRKMSKIFGKDWKEKEPDSWKSMVKSFTFYLGKMSENKSMLNGNQDYIGSVAVMGGRNSQQLLEGNWNVSPEDALDMPIMSEDSSYVFLNDKQINGDRWITADLADTGTDNFLALSWNGFHIDDILILCKTTPRMNAERLQMFAASHDVADNHIIYDAVRGTYINDYIPDAVQYISYRAPLGLYGRMAYKLKDECYLRLCEVIKRHMMSMEDSVALKTYEHQKLTENITIQEEFLEECAVVNFKDLASGKKCLFSKKEMNQQLGKGRSMDLLDPCAMRMLPCLAYVYGEELVKTAMEMNERSEDLYDTINVFDQTNWI